MEDKKQLELFKISTNNQNPYSKVIIISLDKLLIIVVIILIFIILSYILGVKKGKSIALENNLIKREAPIYVIKKTRDEEMPPILTETSKNEDTIQTNLTSIQDVSNVNNVNSVNKEEIISTPKDISNNKPTTTTYIIQLASYKKEDFAQREVKYLKEQGISSGVKSTDKYFILFAGPYSSYKEAQKARANLVKRYKDCFIRKEGN